MIRLDLGLRPYPEFWRAGFALYVRVRDTARAQAGTWTADIRRAAWQELAVLESLIRRLLHLMAMGLILPPLKPLALRPFGVEMTGAGSCGQASAGRRFRVHEASRHGRGGLPPADPAAPHIVALISHGQLLERLARLREVIVNPDPVVRRLARHLRRGAPAVLRDLPVPAHILRRLPPALDTLLIDIDALRLGDPSVRIFADTS